MYLLMRKFEFGGIEEVVWVNALVGSSIKAIAFF